MVALEAMRALPRLLDGRHKIVRGDLGEELLTGSWRRLVLPGSERIGKNSYVFCVLTHFHRHDAPDFVKPWRADGSCGPGG